MRQAILTALFCCVAIASGCDKTDEAHCPMLDLENTIIVSSVDATTTTGSRGTDSDIYLDIELAKGDDMSLYLDDPSTNDFEANTIKTYTVDVTEFAVGDVTKMDIRKDSSLFEGGDWRLDALTVVFREPDGTEHVAYDNPSVKELMTGDETHHLHCP